MPRPTQSANLSSSLCIVRSEGRSYRLFRDSRIALQEQRDIRLCLAKTPSDSSRVCGSENSVRLQNQQDTGRLCHIATWMNSGTMPPRFLERMAYAMIAEDRLGTPSILISPAKNGRNHTGCGDHEVRQQPGAVFLRVRRQSGNCEPSENEAAAK